MLTKQEIQHNLDIVNKQIADACLRSGRSRDDVELIAVSKMNPAEAVIMASECGQLIFGENKVQELCGKQPEVAEATGKEIEWHLIGHLQTNKVKDVVGKVRLIHSVDSVHLAEAIDKESAKKAVISDILLEVNIAGEESKYGLKPDEVLAAVTEIAKLKNVRIKGLMTVAPISDNPVSNRIYFKNLKNLSVDIGSKNIDNISMDVLSMGMTQDFETAIEEGATYVRVGTGIFGARDYSK